MEVVRKFSRTEIPSKKSCANFSNSLLRLIYSPVSVTIVIKSGDGNHTNVVNRSSARANSKLKDFTFNADFSAQQ
jgi:hypothetical protein